MQTERDTFREEAKQLHKMYTQQVEQKEIIQTQYKEKVNRLEARCKIMFEENTSLLDANANTQK